MKMTGLRIEVIAVDDMPPRHCRGSGAVPLLDWPMRREDYPFQGGAAGAEAEFGAQAERYGIDEVNYSFEGHSHVRQRGLRS